MKEAFESQKKEQSTGHPIEKSIDSMKIAKLRKMFVRRLVFRQKHLQAESETIM
jgi:hypothetical protein